MSNLHYEEVLREAITDLRLQLKQDERFSVDSRPPAKDANARTEWYVQQWSVLYVRYVAIFHKFEQCHSLLLQPQKRDLVRLLLDSCIGRMLELRHQIVRHSGEYPRFDQVLLDCGVTPDTLELPVPSYFLESHKKELMRRNELFLSLIKQYGQHTTAQRQQLAFAKEQLRSQIPMTVDEAILVIQVNERGRQGRQRARFMGDIRAQEERERKIVEIGAAADADRAPRAAVAVQKVWRGYVARKAAAKRREEELVFLGMEANPVPETATKMAALKKQRKDIQLQNQLEYDAAKRELADKLRKEDSARLIESLHRDVMSKVATLRETDNSIPYIPPLEPDGTGGVLAFLGDLAPLGDDLALAEGIRLRREAEAAAKPGAARKAALEKAQESGKSSESAAGGSQFWTVFSNCIQRYAEVWTDNFDVRNFYEKYDPDFLKQELVEGPGGLHDEVHRQVDALVRTELHNMKDALDREKNGRFKRGRKPKAPKKSNPARGHKKDITANIKMENLVNELVWTGFLTVAPEEHITHFVGVRDLLGTTQNNQALLTQEQLVVFKTRWEGVLASWNPVIERSLQVSKEQFQRMYDEWASTRGAPPPLTERDRRMLAAQGKQPPSGPPEITLDPRRISFEPTLADVRERVTTQLILPLGSQSIWDMAPHSRTCLLYGAAGTGKSMLAHAVITETGATMFDLSPKVLQDKYTSPRAATLLVHMVFKVAKALAPAVIVIDEVEKVFPNKRKKKDGEGQSAFRIRKDLLSNLKELAPSDRVIVIGMTRTPWLADTRELARVFQNIIFCPTPDFPSRILIWQQELQRAVLGRTAANASKLVGITGSVPGLVSGVVPPEGAPYVSSQGPSYLRTRDDQPPSTHPASDVALEVLTKLSHRYSAGSIVHIIQAVCTPRRMRRVALQPLDPAEFLGGLAQVRALVCMSSCGALPFYVYSLCASTTMQFTPVFRDEYEKFRTYTLALPFVMRMKQPSDFEEAAPEKSRKPA